MTIEDDTKSFKVSDRRSSAAKTDDASEASGPTSDGGGAAKSGSQQGGSGGKEETAPPMSFLTFILSLASSALVHLGEVPDPMTGQTERHPDLAKQTIDILAILQEKTRGNLDDDETRLMENLLPDLQMRYLKTVKFIT